MLTAQQAKIVLSEIISTLRHAEEGGRIRDAMQSAGNDMVKRMQHVYPQLVQIEIDIVARYGYPGDCDGAIKFTQDVTALERDDAEIKRLNAELRDMLIPSLPTASTPTRYGS